MKTKKIVYIGHAVSDERGKASGGSAGDQTTSEVRIQEWYLRSSGWTHVFRLKNKQLRTKMANLVKECCLNDKIGYSQSDRLSIYSGTNKKCNCDCSSLVSYCLNSIGVPVPRDMYTGNEADILVGTKKFYKHTAKGWLTKSAKLEPGDILLGKGHTATVTEVKDIPVFERLLAYKAYSFMRGDDVLELQLALIRRGCLAVGEDDGILGKKTYNAIKLFQKLNNLTADGIAGPNTIKALGYIYEEG